MLTLSIVQQSAFDHMSISVFANERIAIKAFSCAVHDVRRPMDWRWYRQTTIQLHVQYVGAAVDHGWHFVSLKAASRGYSYPASNGQSTLTFFSGAFSNGLHSQSPSLRGYAHIRILISFCDSYQFYRHCLLCIQLVYWGQIDLTCQHSIGLLIIYLP